MQKHGISIGIERIGNTFYMTLKVTGKLTHEDYQTITPMIDSALKGVKNAEILALIDASELEGWELRAAWDDFKMILKHGSEFKKVAIYGHKQWQSSIAKVGGWFISGEVAFFEDIKAAMSWLNQGLEGSN
ncbi:STAS/SEC14 domain-containing protein [Aestuariibacter sp. AA17]|uniref:STAS/SEC14 domain-containing protein n=1 Tax=Fluctibacter corallii TaxID=2984329 RepID=A0ABT3A4W6_9ALTE|nr:STAS/SEC14 domain-containing protein [Aestuariibacter sp. AA17]MCV2883721.1 STAS/SEC14 domain-containing protein [Aestuariibacter sp. AA17]